MPAYRNSRRSILKNEAAEDNSIERHTVLQRGSDLFEQGAVDWPADHALSTY